MTTTLLAILAATDRATLTRLQARAPSRSAWHAAAVRLRTLDQGGTLTPCLPPSRRGIVQRVMRQMELDL